MKSPIDQSVYPDWDEPPTILETIGDRADYVHRICAAWDFGVHPDEDTFDLFRQWRDIFDQYPLLTSPAYHAFRICFGWPAIPIPPGLSAPTPRWLQLDRQEQRPPDPCDGMI